MTPDTWVSMVKVIKVSVGSRDIADLEYKIVFFISLTKASSQFICMIFDSFLSLKKNTGTEDFIKGPRKYG